MHENHNQRWGKKSVMRREGRRRSSWRSGGFHEEVVHLLIRTPLYSFFLPSFSLVLLLFIFLLRSPRARAIALSSILVSKGREKATRRLIYDVASFRRINERNNSPRRIEATLPCWLRLNLDFFRWCLIHLNWLPEDYPLSWFRFFSLFFFLAVFLLLPKRKMHFSFRN